MHEPRDTARSLIDGGDTLTRASIANTLERFGQDALRFALASNVRVRPLARGERYDRASPALARLSIDVDAWPAPPAGLFVVEERCVYARSRSAMTIAHEFGHALDCALGNGVYRSGYCPEVRALFSAAGAFVTPYAATAIDEYFAEAMRAYVEANDVGSHWPRATKARLRRIDPKLFDYVERLFSLELRTRTRRIG